MKYQEIANSTWAQYLTQQVGIRTYRRGRNNCPSKQTFHTEFAVFHSSNPKKMGNLEQRGTTLNCVAHEFK